ncbi:MULTISPECIES: G5 domain-containing protein [unclassified Streptococcus]|uniref:G5 domain-containing protein n=1 Tax=unclassified Streptococcus TaxID=2608887 RepID=UPI00156423CE|nr:MULTISPECIES: G5 domain-containing protein [unclassified Streptococcus]
MSRQSTKNKKYALRKIGKVFGSCVVATVITLGGVAIMAPNVTVYASNTEADPGENNITDFASNDDGYEVRVPKGKRYESDDTVESHKPILKHTGHDGRSFILKAKESENLTKEDIDNHFEDNPMGSLFEKLYDTDENGEVDPEYKRADADAINANAGNPIDGTNFVEPKVSDVDTRYPHRVDAGVTNIADIYDSNGDGKPDNADGQIDDQDTIVEANKPITVNENSEDNEINEDGTVVLSKYYRIHVNKGDTADKDDDIYVVGTKPTVTINEIDFKTIYEPNDQDVAGNQTIKTPGKKGTSTTTTTYTVNPETGARTANPSTTVETEKPVNKVVLVGTKPKVEEKELPFTRRYVEDNTKDKDYRETTQQGVKGKETKTTTYTLDTTNGTVTENNPTTVTEEPKEEIITVGTKPKVEEKELPFTRRYVEDKTKDKDYRETTQQGVKGKETKTTTYTLDTTNGTVTENNPTTVTEQPKEEIITVGTKPKVEEKELPFTTRYVEDNTKDKDYRETTQTGVKGKETKTTTYTLDTTNGTVTENNPTTVTEEPKEEIITVGTKPKVEEKELPFTTRYVEDNTKDKDYRETTQTGVKGKETTTTTYTMDPNTGTVTENTPTVVREEPKEEIITVGTKPKVVETPETPQPGQPTAPEEAPAQPSEPEDQPNLKVAPPTIAIVEEPNKASIEVKAPKKDADTVKIIYPKSNGSGNEVLTLTKQPSGEWTLDKQPENVTLDKKTGTVTIPRESVVNKQKVQARAKHKTSDYTPFVYAALSIEAANPEHPVTLWVDRAGKEIKEKVVGKKVQAGEIAGYKWLSSRLEEGILTHTFEKVANGTPILPESPTSHPRTPSSSPSTSTPEKPNKVETPAVRTVWRDENGKDLKMPSVDKQEAGEVPGYEFVESHREGDNLIVHVFRTKQAQTPAPKDQTPSPTPSKVSEQKGEAVATATSEKTVDSATSTKTSDKAELPNTGTEANASLASAGIMTLLAGLGLGFFKKKED